jgi:hypothetical protein
MAITRPLLPFEGQFTQMPNAWLRDRRLSRRARGLLGEIWSHRAGWRITLKSLVAAGPEGRDAIVTAIGELRDAGYLELQQQRGERGRFGEVEYTLADPFATAPGESGTGERTATGSTGSGFSGSGESDPKNTITTEDDLEEHQDQDSSGHVTFSSAGVGGHDEDSYAQGSPQFVDMRVIAGHIESQCGRTVTPQVLMAIVGTVLERAKTYPDRPTKYVQAAITRNPFGWQKYIDGGKAPR